MNFQGNVAISAQTRATGRTLLTFSATMIFFYLGWIEVADTSIIGLKFSGGSFANVLGVLICLSRIAHFIHWYADMISAQRWNITGKLLGRVQHDGKAGATRLDRLLQDVNEYLAASRMDQHSASAHARPQELERRLAEFCGGVASFGRYAIIYIYIYHLLVPVAAGMIALGLFAFA